MDHDADGKYLTAFLEHETLAMLMPMINAFYGVNLTLTDFIEMGKEMLRQERAFTSGQRSDRVQTGSPIE